MQQERSANVVPSLICLSLYYHFKNIYLSLLIVSINCKYGRNFAVLLRRRPTSVVPSRFFCLCKETMFVLNIIISKIYIQCCVFSAIIFMGFTATTFQAAMLTAYVLLMYNCKSCYSVAVMSEIVFVSFVLKSFSYGLL